MPTVDEIVEMYLKEQKLDGLVDEDMECACKLGGLAPCGGMRQGCVAGKISPCDCGDHDWHIIPSTHPAQSGGEGVK